MSKLTSPQPIPSRSIVRRVEGYEPICLFARGGMAQVFLARTLEEPKRLVAIKTLRISCIDDPDSVAMFVDEMRIAHLLQHENIVELVEAGIIEGEPFLVLEFIDGASLRELADHHYEIDEPMEPAIVVALMLGAARGLSHAHQLTDEWGTSLELVHRDINPQNLMVDRAGVTKVLDFGVAKAVGQSHQTIGHGVKGKMAYAAPEYIRGEAPDQRADIFGLGVVMAELLWNRRLFFRPTAVGTMQAVVFEEVTPPLRREGAEEVFLDAIVLAAIAKNPDERIATADAFVERLEAAAELLGGELTEEEIAETLSFDEPELLPARDILEPEMSDEQLGRGLSRPPSRPPTRASQEGEKSLEIRSVEIDLSDFDDSV